METIEELQEFIGVLSQSSTRGRLLARGEARAINRRFGEQLEGSPRFAITIDTDLSEYGFSMLRASLALREIQKDNTTAYREGFLKAGNAFEALVRNSSPNMPYRGFWHVMGAASYHLAGHAAMAFSLMKQAGNEANLAPAEKTILRLLLCDLEKLRFEAEEWLHNPRHSDDFVHTQLKGDEENFEEAFYIILTKAVYRAFAFFEFSLLTGDDGMYGEAASILQRALRVANSVGAVTMWWIIRIAINLLDGLWTNSLHQILPKDGPAGAKHYATLREKFLSSLYSRKTSEVELWPSQICAAQRAVHLEDDLVVSLPTSAGKTRVAEICALMSLSNEQRVLLITPLRALSAQTERSFRKTFGPLGFSVSAIYGPNEAMPDRQDVLHSNKIVVATPEKLDFALRSNPQLINDIGLVVFDEGHLIGPNERELRYEILVQRLLRRGDANARRIVCLSAILPDGDQLEDFTKWIRNDSEGNPVKSPWRPTRQRFGVLTWSGHSAHLKIHPDADGLFINHFIREKPPIKPRRTPFPKDNKELTLAAAWKFAEEDKRTLIFCTQRGHVESYAHEIVNLTRRGFLHPLLGDLNQIERAKSIGIELLGSDHPAVNCLKLGVAIHHARLPRPFLREVEHLLNEGILTVTVASPTLAQGLNLNAAVLLVPSLHRAGIPIPSEEFANVAGRAGRAFVDLEGLIIHVMFDNHLRRRSVWDNLVNSSRTRNLESGIIQISQEILARLERSGVLRHEDDFEYLANNHDAWNIQDDNRNEESFELLLDKLDHAIFNLVEALDAEDADLPQLLDTALTNSLWARQLARRQGEAKKFQLKLFQARSRLIWSRTSSKQRRGHFAMGVGLDAGLTLDEMFSDLELLVDQADQAALRNDEDSLISALEALAERLLIVRPFKPNKELNPEWRNILSSWLSGVPINQIGSNNVSFIEEIFIYRLVWALEAIRLRRLTLGWQPEFINSAASACLETGVPQYKMAMLIRAGLPSRSAAMTVISQQDPTFKNIEDLVNWLATDEVEKMTNIKNWPTPETHGIWKKFRSEMLNRGNQEWTTEEWKVNIDPSTLQMQPILNQIYRVKVDKVNKTLSVLTPDFESIVTLKCTMIDPQPSVLTAKFSDNYNQMIIRRLGIAPYLSPGINKA